MLKCVSVGVYHHLLQLRAEVCGVCCSLLQYVAGCCMVLQHVALVICHHLRAEVYGVCCSVGQGVLAVGCSK